jgi:hypothetical protein
MVRTPTVPLPGVEQPRDFFLLAAREPRQLRAAADQDNIAKPVWSNSLVACHGRPVHSVVNRAGLLFPIAQEVGLEEGLRHMHGIKRSEATVMTISSGSSYDISLQPAEFEGC